MASTPRRSNTPLANHNATSYGFFLSLGFRGLRVLGVGFGRSDRATPSSNRLNFSVSASSTPRERAVSTKRLCWAGSSGFGLDGIGPSISDRLFGRKETESEASIRTDSLGLTGFAASGSKPLRRMRGCGAP